MGFQVGNALVTFEWVVGSERRCWKLGMLGDKISMREMAILRAELAGLSLSQLSLALVYA